MSEKQVTIGNLQEHINELQDMLMASPVLVVSIQDASTGKWGMARLWRVWMKATSDWMTKQGATMPLVIQKDGQPYGKRPFDEDDAHALFTYQWLGSDENGKRLSWAKSQQKDSGRVATRGERYDAMRKHEQWALERGILLMKPRDSEYMKIAQECGE